MIPIQPFDPIATPNGVIKTNGINKGEQVLLYNSSLACLQLTFADKTQDVLPPCWARTWEKESPMKDITYTTLFTLNMNGQPVSEVYGTLYQPGEHISEVNGPLQYVYIAGGGSVSVNTTPFVTNTGYALGTVFISASFVNETPGHAEVIIRNDGTMNLGQDNNGVLTLTGPGGNPTTTVLQGYGSIVCSTNGVLEYQFQTSLTSTLAELDLYKLGTKNIAITGDGNIAMNGTLKPVGAHDLFINAASSHSIIMQYNGTNTFTITSTGANLVAGTLGLIVGSLSRIALFSGTATSTSSAFTHNLGVIPDLILLTLSGTTSSLSMVKYDPATVTSTQVNVISDSSRTFVGVAIKL